MLAEEKIEEQANKLDSICEKFDIVHDSETRLQNELEKTRKELALRDPIRAIHEMEQTIANMKEQAKKLAEAIGLPEGAALGEVVDRCTALAAVEKRQKEFLRIIYSTDISLASMVNRLREVK